MRKLAPRERYLLGLTLLGLLLAALVFRDLMVGEGFFYPARDFLNVWAGPRIARADFPALFDMPRYTADLVRMLGHPIYDHAWSYPLYCLWFFLPFSWLPYPVAYAVWTLLGIGLYLLAFRKASPERPSPLLLACILLSPIVIINSFSSQNGLYTGALGLFALTQLEKRPTLAGFLIGLLACKPHLGLLWPVLLIARRAWRTFLVAGCTVATLFVASLLVHGSWAWEQYFTVTAPFQAALATSAVRIDGGYNTYHLMMAGVLPALRLLGFSITTASAVQAAVTLATVVAAYVGFRHSRTLAQRTLLLGAGMLLATPYGFNHDMGLLFLGLLLDWQTNPPRTASERWRGGLCYLLPWIMCKTNGLPLPVSPLIIGWVFVATLRTVWRERAAPAGRP